MNKKIIILNGSPRLKGNTAGLIDAFVQGAEQAGHTVKTFNLQKMNIHPCLGCLGGGKNPDSPCTQKDDMDRSILFMRKRILWYWHHRCITGALPPS